VRRLPRPSREQTCLLRACLHDGESARGAWECWRAAVGDVEGFVRADRWGIKRLLPLLLDAARRNHLPVPGEFRTALKAASLREELRWLTYRRLCGNVLSRLATAGIPFLVLNGAALAEQAYPEPALRHCHDIDLLVGACDPAALTACLSGIGFAPVGQRRSPERGLRFEHDSGLPLAFHRAPFAGAAGAAAVHGCWARSRIREVGGVPARVLCPADALLQLCAHAPRSEGSGPLVRVCDAWFTIRRQPGPEWSILADAVRRCGVGPRVVGFLAYLRDELHAPVPESLSAAASAAASSLHATG
jgi:hypothetical protein